VGDDPSSVIANRELVSKEFSTSTLVFMSQSHSAKILEVTSNENRTLDCDGIFTRKTNVALAVLVADCIPLLLHTNSMVAAIHVGRRGLVAGIVETMVEQFRISSSDPITAEIGPAICGDCYEVDLETYREVTARYPATATSEVKRKLDLKLGANQLLRSFGVEVNDWNRCTLHDVGYFSYRRDGRTGRQAGIIAL
jgi:YfiH family protein